LYGWGWPWSYGSWIDNYLCNPGADTGGGARPLKLEKIWFFGVKSWFFTRNTPKFSRLPPLGAIFFKSAPPNLKSWIRPCNQWLSPLMLWVRNSTRARCTTLCDKVCKWLATGRWFSPGTPVSSTNKTDRHDTAEILLKVVLNTIKQANIQ
jgi:hypothetical protein